MPSTRSAPPRVSRRYGHATIGSAAPEADGGASRRSWVAAVGHRARDLDRLAAEMLRPLALPALRVLLGVLFLWFGGLKVAGVSPVKAMVAGTLPWADPNMIVPVLGGVEVLLGLALVTGVALRLALPALAAHLAGTFLTFVMLPGQMMSHANPLLLTQNGEFVMKNLVLISAALVLIAHPRRPAAAPQPVPAAATSRAPERRNRPASARRGPVTILLTEGSAGRTPNCAAPRPTQIRTARTPSPAGR